MYLRSIKPLADFLAAGMLLFLTLPVLSVLTIAIRLQQKSIFFFQLRTGKNGRRFYIIKFKTMSNAQDEDGNLLPDVLRITALGNFMRTWSLDELPQLINVLKGDMSLVGPRPLLPEYESLYSVQQARRHEVMPGLTGWSQVNGRNALSWSEKFKLDLYYVEQISFLLDVRILFRTGIKVLTRQGIKASESQTMEKFTG